MRPLKLTTEMLQNILTGVTTALQDSPLTTDKINYSVNLKDYCNADKPKDKLTLYFTATAFLKQRILIQECKDEVGWHGIVNKISDTEYLIEDILVFPQIVSGVTVTPDEVEYSNWMLQFFQDDEDTTIERMRFHGHSHVNMGVSPSGTDINYQQDMLAHIKDYYIFLIANKQNNINVVMYDICNNIYYDNSDIDYKIVLDNGTQLTEWYRDQSKLITTRYFTSNTTTTHYINTRTEPHAAVSNPSVVNLAKNEIKSSYFDEKLQLWTTTFANKRKFYSVRDPKAFTNQDMLMYGFCAAAERKNK